jgi:hypothetical protein
MGSPIELRETMFGTGDKFYTSDALNVVAFGLLNNPSRSPNTIQTITTPMLRNWWRGPKDQAKSSGSFLAPWSGMAIRWPRLVGTWCKKINP